MNDILAIKNYIFYLKKECGLSISIHSHNSSLILKKELLAFNIHENPYCVYVKSCNEAQKHCIETQAKVVKKCTDGAFIGTCWAGVKEYVYPVTANDKIIGFICVSGFKDEKAEQYLSRVAKNYILEYKQLQSTYRALDIKNPDKNYVDTLIYPLCHMLELAHIKAESKFQQEDSFIRKIVQYIKKNYTQDISSETLCEEFHCSRAYLSKLFNRELKTTLREYITNLRIETAKNLLQYTKLNISEIASSVGFNEAYYFSLIFKKHVGIPPSVYKKRYR